MVNTHTNQGGGDITEMENSYYGVLLRFITVYYGYYGLLLRILRDFFLKDLLTLDQDLEKSSLDPHI
jgi:hypothetical protein